MSPRYERVPTSRPSDAHPNGPSAIPDVVTFLRDTVAEGGRILIERGGIMYELVTDDDGDMHIEMLGPESGA